jgi:hypothetical protein
MFLIQLDCTLQRSIPHPLVPTMDGPIVVLGHHFVDEQMGNALQMAGAQILKAKNANRMPKETTSTIWMTSPKPKGISDEINKY